MNIRYAVFDMDGTLINSLIVWDVVWSKIGARYLHDASFRPTDDDDRRTRTMTLLDAMTYIADTYHLGVDGASLNDYATELCADFYANEVQLKDGVREFLETLKANGVRMLVATATDLDLVSVAVEHLSLGQYFETILSCATVGKGKDHPDIYLASLQYFDAKPEDVWVFEDSAVALVTAKGIGMHTVGIYDACNYGQEILSREADHYIAEGETLLRLTDGGLL